MGNIIEGKLFPRRNREKSRAAKIWDVKFRGHAFYNKGGKGHFRPHPKSVSKMKAKIKELTSRNNGWGDDRRKRELRQFIIGWVNYFKLADMKGILRDIDAW